MWNPEMPFAPVTIAVRSLMSREKVGRFLKIPEFLNGRFLEPIVLVGIGHRDGERKGLGREMLYNARKAQYA